MRDLAIRALAIFCGLAAISGRMPPEISLSAYLVSSYAEYFDWGLHKVTGQRRGVPLPFSIEVKNTALWHTCVQHICASIYAGLILAVWRFKGQHIIAPLQLWCCALCRIYKLQIQFELSNIENTYLYNYQGYRWVVAYECVLMVAEILELIGQNYLLVDRGNQTLLAIKSSWLHAAAWTMSQYYWHFLVTAQLSSFIYSLLSVLGLLNKCWDMDLPFPPESGFNTSL